MKFQKSAFIKQMNSSWKNWYERENCAQVLNFYISSDCSDSQNYSESSRDSLDETVEFFLSDSEQKLLLVLGDSGSGKTSLTLKLERDYWENKKARKTFKKHVPIRIDLKSYKTSNVKQCIEDTLRTKYKLSDETISSLKESKDIQLLVIFDGYDEIGGRAKFNIFKESGLHEWNCRVKSIVTCRVQHFSDSQEFKKCFRLRQGVTHTQQDDALKIGYLAPFSEAQMNEYLVQYAKNDKKKKNTIKFPLKTIQELLKTQSDFKELISNPYVLQIFSEVAPKLLNSKQSSVGARDFKINRTEIYQAFLEDWFSTARERLESSVRNFEVKNKKGKVRDVEEYFFQYARRLAYVYFSNGITELKYEVNSIEDSEFEDSEAVTEGHNAFEEFFSDEKAEAIEARRACPLRRSGDNTYSFVHKSFQDYLVARHLYLALKQKKITKKIIEIWKVRYLSEDRAVLRFLAELVAIDDEKRILEERLLELVKASSSTKSSKGIEKASSNAISVLNWNRYSFSGMDLQKIRIPRAYLEGVNFFGANLSASKLTGSYVRNSEWSEANLGGSDLRGLEYGEYPDWEQEGEVTCLVFNAQGTLVATGDDEGYLRLWRYPDGELLRSWEGHRGRINSVSFSVDGKRLASGGWGRTVRVWDVESGKEERALLGHTDTVRSVSFSCDGKRLASGGTDRTIRLWDVESGKEERALLGHTGTVTSVSFSCDGKRLASGGWDSTIGVWDVESGLKERALLGHRRVIRSVSFSCDGKRLASGSEDKTIRIWDVESGKEERELLGHTREVISVSWNCDGKRLASGGDDETIRIWDVESGKEERVLLGHTNAVTSVSWSSDGKRIVSWGRDKTIRTWGVESGQEERALLGHKYSVESVSFSCDGKRLASGGLDKTIRIWGVESGLEERVLVGHIHWVRSVSFNLDGRRLASGSEDNTIRIWSVESGLEERVLVGHAGSVTSVSFSLDGRRLASGSEDNTIRIWLVESGLEERVLAGHTHPVRSVSSSFDGKRIASGGMDKTIRIWGVESGKEERALLGHTDDVTSVSFSCDGKRLASGGRDKTIRVWLLESGLEERVLVGHTGIVESVDFSRDGKRLASGSYDRTIRLWDVESGQSIEVAILNHIVNDVSFCKSSDKREEYLAAGIGNGVYVFSVIQCDIDPKLRLILKWRTEFYLWAHNANLENAKIDYINRRLLEQRGAKKSNPNVQSQPSEDIPSSSVQSESTKKLEGVIDMFIYWKKQPLTLALLSRWNKEELDTFKFNLIVYAEQQAEATKDNEVEQTEWHMLVAVITDKLNSLKVLAKEDEDVLYIMNTRDTLKGNTLLHWACLFNCQTTAKWLLKKGITGSDEENDLGLRSIHMAIVGDAVEVITLENWKNAEMPAVEVEVNTNKKISCLPLPFAVLIGRERMMHHLLSISQYEETVESQSTFGNILHLAVWGEHAELLQRLLYDERVKKHNLYNKSDDKNRTTLGLAVFLGQYMLMRILLQHPSIEVNAHRPLRVPAHIGVEQGDKKAVRKLIHWGASIEIEEEGNNLKEHARALCNSIPQSEARRNPQWVKWNGLVNFIGQERARNERERYRGELGVKLTKIENLTFRGGGGKAIAYGGALEEITGKLPDFWKNLKRVGGTSAGALTSLLIGVGCLPQKVSELLKDFNFEAIIKSGIGSTTSKLDKSLRKTLMPALKLCATGIQGAYAAKQTQSFLDVFLPLWKARKFTGLSDGEVLRNKLKELVKNALITQGFSTTIQDGKTYLTHSGKIIGENQPLLNQDLGLLTLGHWKMIVEGSLNAQHLYKHVYIVTSCVSGREMGVEVFNSESGSYDDVVMIDPVACSMSYPFAIEPQKVRRVTGDGQSQLSQESYLDGGMLMNDPKKLFDAHGYVDPHDKLGDKRFPRYNKKTLSLTLFSEAPPEFDIPEEKEVKTIFGLIKVFASFYLHAEVYLRAAGYTEQYREIAISDCGVTVRDLNMISEDKEKLQASGRAATKKFMHRLNHSGEDPTSSADTAPAFDPAHPVGPSIKK